MPASGDRTVRSVVPGRAIRLLRVLVATGLLLYIFSHIGLQTVITAIEGANLSMLSLAFLVVIIVQLIVSYRLKCLTDTQGLDLPTLRVFEVNLATRFYGMFLPGGNVTALLIRIFKFTQERSHIARVVTSLLADRIMATLSLCILGLIFWVLLQPGPDGLWLLVFALASIACGVVTYALFGRCPPSGSGRLEMLLQKLGPRLREKLSLVLQRPCQTSGKILAGSFVLSVVAHLVGVVGYWLIAQSLDMALTLLVIAWVRSGIMLLTLLPVTIAGLGVRELAALVLLQQFGVESDMAIAFSMLVFATTVVGIGLLGGLTEAWRFVQASKR